MVLRFICVLTLKMKHWILYNIIILRLLIITVTYVILGRYILVTVLECLNLYVKRFIFLN